MELSPEVIVESSRSERDITVRTRPVRTDNSVDAHGVHARGETRAQTVGEAEAVDRRSVGPVIELSYIRPCLVGAVLMVLEHDASSAEHGVGGEVSAPPVAEYRTVEVIGGDVLHDVVGGADVMRVTTSKRSTANLYRPVSARVSNIQVSDGSVIGQVIRMTEARSTNVRIKRRYSKADANVRLRKCTGRRKQDSGGNGFHVLPPVMT